MSRRRLEIEASRPHAVFAVLAFGAVSAVFAALPIWGLVRVAEGEANVWAMLAISVVIVAVGLIVWTHFVIAVQTLVMRGPIITIGPEGFRDRRISEDTVPWDNFLWSRDRVKIGYVGQIGITGRQVDEVVFDVEGPYRVTPHYRLLGVASRVLCKSPWRVVTIGTGVQVPEIVRAIRTHGTRPTPSGPSSSPPSPEPPTPPPPPPPPLRPPPPPPL